MQELATRVAIAGHCLAFLGTRAIKLLRAQTEKVFNGDNGGS